MDVELHDWEVLDDDTHPLQSSILLPDSQQIIRSDYFSIDSHLQNNNNNINNIPDDVTDQDKLSVHSDNPSWIDPDTHTDYSTTKPIHQFSTSSEDGDESLSDLGSLSDSGGIESKKAEFGGLVCDGELGGVEAKRVDEGVVGMGGERNNMGAVAVWWKLPFDLLKYCLFKASPVWTLSAAAAMMGVVILGRRLYRMRQKTRSLQLRVALDDKKVSQVMSRAARLNEAFSVVRAPIIRPSLPAAGIAPWPMMALR